MNNKANCFLFPKLLFLINDTCFNENSDASVLVALVRDWTGIFGNITAASNANATAPDPYAAAANPNAAGPHPHRTGPLAHP